MHHEEYLAQERANRERPAKLAHDAEIAVNIAISRKFESDEFRDFVKQVIREEIANAQHLRGASGSDGAPGKDGATIYEVLDVIDQALSADPERFRGAAGQDGVSVKGEKGDPGADSVVAGPAGRDGADSTIAGPKGDSPSKEELVNLIREVIAQDPEKFRGAPGKSVAGRDGRDGNDAVSLDQIREAVVETVVEVLKNEVSQQLAQAQIAAIRQELHKIDALSDTRPSLRPIFSDMTNRIRAIIR